MADQTPAERRSLRNASTGHTIESIEASNDAATQRWIETQNSKLDQDQAFQDIWQRIKTAPTPEVSKALVSQANQYLSSHGFTDLDGSPLQVGGHPSTFAHASHGNGLDSTGHINTNPSGNFWTGMAGWERMAIIGLATAGVASAAAGAGGAAGGAGGGAAGGAGGAGGAAGAGAAGAGAAGAGAAGAGAAGAGGWLGALGTYSPLIGEVGTIAGRIAQGRATGRLAESTANLNAFETESQAYDDAVKRSLIGQLMQTEMPSVKPPANVQPYSGTVSPGLPSPAGPGTADALISGAAPTLAHPPVFDASQMNPQPNWIDTALNIIAPVASTAGALGRYVRPQSTGTTQPPGMDAPENNMARRTGTAMSDLSGSNSGAASFLTGTELPPYAAPGREQGLEYPTSDPAMAGVSFLPPRYQVPRAFRNYNFRR